MILRPFEYVAPSNLKEAIGFLEAHREGSKILAGGHSLIPMLKFHLFNVNYVVDINRLNELEYIRGLGDRLVIGALTRYAAIEEDEAIRSRFPALSDAVGHIGDPLVRNLGTVGGNLCHCDPANDLPAVMLALDASFTAAGPSGERVIPSREFFVNTFQTSLEEFEILTQIQLPYPKFRCGSAYAKLERRVGDFPTVAVAAQVQVDDLQFCQGVGLGLTAVAPKALKPRTAEDALLGRKIGEKEIQNAAALAAGEAQPTSDLRGSVQYKKEMVRIFTIRALRSALARVRGA